MFTLNEDLSIYATRGDIVFFSVTAEDDGVAYQFQAGDVVRIKVYGKKAAENVVLQKDFPVTAATDSVQIFLTEDDTKIGEVISKPTDYWYEVELNPESNPQTIIGYDEDGAKVFKLFPEGDDIPPYEPTKPEDIPVVDDELDLTSTRPVENQAIARAIVAMQAELDETQMEYAEKMEDTNAMVAGVSADVVVERARIDNLVSGATAGDEELVDIRVGADGVTYGSAGTAVREQANRAFQETATLNRNLMHIAPLYGATEKELAAMRAIRFIIPNGFDLSGYRLGIVQNNDEFPYTLRFVYDGGVAGLFEPVTKGDYSVLTWNGVIIGIDWGKIEEINKTYANSHLEMCAEDGPVEYVLEQVEKRKAENDILKEAIVLCGVPGDEVESTLSISGAWIRTDGTGIGTNSSDLLSVSVYPVTAGIEYMLHGEAKLAADNYPMAVFSEYGTQDEFKTEEMIIPGGDVTTLKNYNVLYTPTVDGYVWVAEYNGYKVTVAGVAGYTTASVGLKTPLKVQLFGDSVTDDYWGDNRTWATLLPYKLPECDLTVVNSAVGGCGIGHGHSGTARYADKEYNYVCDLLDDGTLEADNDAIIVCVGTNDWAAGRALGKWGDTSVTTFYGAVRYMVEQISKNTSAKLIVCTPLQRYNSTDEGRATDKNGTPVNALGYTLRAYCDAFVETCEFYGIPCVDLHKTIGWNKYNIKKFCGDGLHPNNKGDEWIARIICNEIRYHCL